MQKVFALNSDTLCNSPFCLLYFFVETEQKAGADDWRNGGKCLIAVIHKGKNFEEMMERFQQKRAEFVAQEIRFFDAETLHCLIQMLQCSGHKLEEITGLAV